MAASKKIEEKMYLRIFVFVIGIESEVEKTSISAKNFAMSCMCRWVHKQGWQTSQGFVDKLIKVCNEEKTLFC